MKNKMTIHRALAELKLIDSKILKGLQQIEPVGIKQKDGLINNLVTKENFNKEAISKFDSVNDLIQRKIDIKSEIVKVNSETIIKLNGREMTISDAINYKNIINLKKELVSSLNDKYVRTLSLFNTKNEEVNKVALDNAKIMIGKQGDERVKPTDDDVKNIVEPFVKRNEFHFIDPLGIKNLIDTMQNEIDEFESEVDATLSEANSTTFIEV